MTCYGMVILFATLLIAEIIAFIFLNVLLKKKKADKKIKLLITVLWVCALVFTAKLLIAPHVQSIETTGAYQITSQDYWLTEDKADPYSDDGEMRQLQIRKWEPVDCKETMPVVVATHGSCGTIDNNLTLYKELASHGYTVLAVCHPGQAAYMTNSDGKINGPDMGFLKQMTSIQPNSKADEAFSIFKEWMSIRVDDLNTVMDDYIAGNGNTEFVMLGHSLGGSAAYAMARIRTDVIACISLEAPFMYDITGVQNGEFVFDETPYDVPLLNIYSDSSYNHLQEWSQYKINADMVENPGKLYTNIYYPGIGHMGLCDLSAASPLFAAIMDGGFQKIDANKQLEIINADCISWLQKVRNSQD